MRRVSIFSALVLCVFVSTSRAEITFGFAASERPGAAEFFWAPPDAPSTGGSTTLLVTPGEAVRISVFLLQQGGDTRLSTDGLLLAGLQGNFGTNDGRVDGVIGKNLPFETGVNPPTPVYRFTEGPAPSFDNTAGTFRIGGGVDLEDPRIVAGQFPGRASGSAFVGYFDFTLASNAPATITFSDPDPASTFANNVLNDASFTSLDSELFSNNGFSTSVLTVSSITSVPEPSMAMALAFLGGMVSLRRRRR